MESGICNAAPTAPTRLLESVGRLSQAIADEHEWHTNLLSSVEIRGLRRSLGLSRGVWKGA